MRNRKVRRFLTSAGEDSVEEMLTASIVWRDMLAGLWEQDPMIDPQDALNVIRVVEHSIGNWASEVIERYNEETMIIRPAEQKLLETLRLSPFRDREKVLARLQKLADKFVEPDAEKRIDIRPQA